MEIIMKTFKNTLLTLLLTTLTSSALLPMKRPNSGDLPDAPDAKRPKTEAESKKPKFFTLLCAGDVKISDVSYNVLAQSEVLKTLIADMGGIDTIASGTEIPVQNISYDVMRMLIRLMSMTANAQAQGLSKKHIIDNLRLSLAGTWRPLKNSFMLTAKKLIALLNASNYLNCPLIYKALSCLISENLQILGLYTLSGGYMLPDHATSIQKAYWILHRKPINPESHVKLSLDDLTDFGLIRPEFIEQDIASILNDIFEKQINAHVLQNYLDAISSFPCFTQHSIKTHHVIMDCIRVLTLAEMQQFFAQLTTESMLKMALRLAYAQKYNQNLDALDCVDFVQNIHDWVNKDDDEFGEEVGSTELFSQNNLQYVLPLLEPLVNKPVINLNLSYNRLRNLPDSIGNLINLKSLDLHANGLTTLPDCFANLVNLQHLNLDENQLVQVPICIFSLVNLQHLNLSRNKLTQLPDFFGNLVKLQILFLSGNQLYFVPDSIGNLVNLTLLNLENNNLSIIRNSFVKLINLNVLHLEDNKFDEPTKQALTKQFGHINEFDI